MLYKKKEEIFKKIRSNSKIVNKNKHLIRKSVDISDEEDNGNSNRKLSMEINNNLLEEEEKQKEI